MSFLHNGPKDNVHVLIGDMFFVERYRGLVDGALYVDGKFF